MGPRKNVARLPGPDLEETDTLSTTPRLTSHAAPAQRQLRSPAEASGASSDCCTLPPGSSALPTVVQHPQRPDSLTAGGRRLAQQSRPRAGPALVLVQAALKSVRPRAGVPAVRGDQHRGAVHACHIHGPAQRHPPPAVHDVGGRIVPTSCSVRWLRQHLVHCVGTAARASQRLLYRVPAESQDSHDPSAYLDGPSFAQVLRRNRDVRGEPRSLR